jgi:hypothetical protein
MVIPNNYLRAERSRGAFGKCPSTVVQDELNKKAAASTPQPKKQGTEKDLVPVYRRTPRRQIANCIGGCEDHVQHQECAPFF